MAFCGALIFVVELTDGMRPPLMRNENDRSKMHRKSRDLWGIIASGEILRFSGKLSIMSPNRTSLAYPSRTFSSVCRNNDRRARSDLADSWGPRLIAVMISSFVHGFPQSTGHPFVLYEWRSGAASCQLAIPRGHMSPIRCFGAIVSCALGVVLGVVVGVSVLSGAVVSVLPMRGDVVDLPISLVTGISGGR